MVLHLILLSQSWSTTVPNFMLVSGKAQSGQNLALSLLAKQLSLKVFLSVVHFDFCTRVCIIKQLMHTFDVDIRICQPEDSDVHRGEVEMNITFEG